MLLVGVSTESRHQPGSLIHIQRLRWLHTYGNHSTGVMHRQGVGKRLVANQVAHPFRSDGGKHEPIL